MTPRRASLLYWRVQEVHAINAACVNPATISTARGSNPRVTEL